MRSDAFEPCVWRIERKHEIVRGPGTLPASFGFVKERRRPLKRRGWRLLPSYPKSSLLSRELEAGWPDFNKYDSISMGVKHKAAVGVRFLEVVRDTMAGLGNHLLDRDGSVVAFEPDVAAVGDRDAFASFVKIARERLPRAATSLVV